MKLISILLTTSLVFSGCATAPLKSAEMYTHRVPKVPVGFVETEPGKYERIIPWKDITSNAADLGFSVSEIVRAVVGSGGFPFSIVPVSIKYFFSGAEKLKEETRDQEVYKVRWVEGMEGIRIQLPDGTKIEATSDAFPDSNKKEEGTQV